MKKIILIDGNSLMYRAYFATAYTGVLMQTTTGIYTNAIYSFINMMNKVLSSEQFDNIFIAFDKGKNTFRHKAYEGYKEGRKKMAPELAMQIPLIKEYLDIMNIARLETDEYEADDLIATFATLAKNEDYEVLVLSSDHDLLQLVDDKVTVGLTVKGISEIVYYTPSNFYELKKYHANQVADYKALYGDDSDNLKGVSGVGELTAIKLLEKYQNLENIYLHIDELKGKQKENFIKDEFVARQCKELATLQRYAKIDMTLNDTIYKAPNQELLRKFFEKLEFKSFIKKLEQKTTDVNIIDEKQVEINNVTLLINEIETLEKEKPNIKELTLEFEIDKENYQKANIIGFSLTTKEYGFYFDASFLYHKTVKAILEDENIIINAIDSKKACHLLYRYGISAKFSFDVLLCAYVEDPALANHDLRYIFDYYENTSLPYFEEIYGKKTTYQIPDIELLAKYSTDKGNYTNCLKNKMIEKLASSNQLSLLYNIEMPLAIVLFEIEANGFKVNKRRLDEIGLFLEDSLKDLEQEIYELVGKPFNISSPKQLGIILFEELKLGKGKKNKTGYSTAADVLEKLAKDHLVPRKILEYRKYNKLLTTYVIGLSNEISSLDNKVHTTFKQALTSTGRLSSIEPNIQNIPIRTQDGRLIRSAFVPSFEGGMLISADYSQIELRVLAHASGCQKMIENFNQGVDFHSLTAANIYNVSLNEVTKDMRRVAKAVNFGIVYGISEWGLSDELGIPVNDAREFSNKYFEIYPEIRTYLNQVVEDTKENLYTTTIFNRRRYIKDINSTNYNLAELAKRMAMNAPIQGSAADIIKIAMIDVAKKLKEMNLKSKMVAQVHDELIIDSPYEEVEIIKKLLKETMENAVSLSVKMEVEVETGATWDLK